MVHYRHHALTRTVELLLRRLKVQRRLIRCTLVHFMNVSGHSSTAYFAPIEMRDVRVELTGTSASATAIGLDQKFPVTPRGIGTSAFTLPRVGEYEVMVLE